MPTYEVETVRFGQANAHDVNGARSWCARGQNFAVVYSVLDEGAELAWRDDEYEYIVGVVEGTVAMRRRPAPNSLPRMLNGNFIALAHFPMGKRVRRRRCTS